MHEETHPLILKVSTKIPAECLRNFCNMLVEVNKQSEMKLTNPTNTDPNMC